ncbi:alkaline phosphatase family protein [Halorhabdus sp. CUG00001]|uniref:alkaline phosphatase family protein n=1 Tax=Halorhabdus sp. CUG00001 TaxID=2600297 RepID=UPI00131B6F02|nr:alkaline phosphatase family protein [Halorhabdus sp. CUG00001]
MELLVIGLDGLSYNMLDRFGIEPEFIDRVTDDGVSGDLMSVDTPTTLPAWTSFQTGKDPGSHGLTNMITQAPDYETGPFETNTTDAALYDFVDDAVVINLPASVGRRPAAENTHLVSAMLAKDKADATPDHLQDLASYEAYILDHDKSKKKRPSVYFNHVCEITERRRDFAREAFETYDPRFGFVLFSTPDWAGHLLSNFSDDEERAGYYEQLISVVDSCAADLAELADNVVLMSDHGFEKKTHNVHLNDWLADAGYLEVESEAVRPQHVAVAAAKAVGKRSDWIYEQIRRVYNYIIGTDVGQSLQAAAESEVDYPASQAWELRYGCVFINDERFDHPSVEDPAALRAELKTAIASITDSEGNPAFRDVLLAEEAYKDPGEWAPDLIARPAPGRYPTMLDSPTGEPVSPTNNYNHRYRGLIAAEGPAFEDNETVEGMSIVDVLPTVLHVLGQSQSPEFDGRVREDLLTIDREVTTLNHDAVPRPRVRSDDTDQDDRDDVVESRLEDLGYIE